MAAKLPPALVSVIIPCRNGAEWLSEAIESCLRQTWPLVEIIVVDNGSTDASLDVAKRYESASVIVLECRRSGASAARNAGLEWARGKFIQFLDADDVLHPDKIRVQMERLAAAPGAVASGAWTRFRHSPLEASFSPEPVWRDSAPEEFPIASWLGGGMMPSFAWLSPRAIVERAGPWNERLSLNDDGEFFCRVVLASSGIVFCNDARGYYRTCSDSSLSRRRDAEALASVFEATELSCRWLLQRCDSRLSRQACATQYQRFIYDAYPDVPELVAAAERHVSKLGGSALEIGGGRAFKMIRGCFGWKFAQRCRRARQRLQRVAAAGAALRSRPHDSFEPSLADPTPKNPR